MIPDGFARGIGSPGWFGRPLSVAVNYSFLNQGLEGQRGAGKTDLLGKKRARAGTPREPDRFFAGD